MALFGDSKLLATSGKSFLYTYNVEKQQDNNSDLETTWHHLLTDGKKIWKS